MAYDDVIRLQLERFGFQMFAAQPLAVDKCTVDTVETVDVLDVNLESEVTLMYLREKRVGNHLFVL